MDTVSTDKRIVGRHAQAMYTCPEKSLVMSNGSIVEMTLTAQQQRVLDKVDEFMKGDASVFILCGYAGTGKPLWSSILPTMFHGSVPWR